MLQLPTMHVGVYVFGRKYNLHVVLRMKYICHLIISCVELCGLKVACRVGRHEGKGVCQEAQYSTPLLAAALLDRQND